MYKEQKEMILSHHYFDLDSEIIFNVCKNEINELFKVTSKMIDELQD